MEFVGIGVGDEKNISKELTGDERPPWVECTKLFNKRNKKKWIENILPDPNVGLNGVRLLPNSTVSDEETPKIRMKISRKRKSIEKFYCQV